MVEKHIRVVTPVVSDRLRLEERSSPEDGTATRISYCTIERGPASVESEFDIALAAPDTVARIMEAERDGVDAVVINCMADPGLGAGREVVSIPVLGPCETTMHLAAMLGHKFSVVTVLDRIVPIFEDRARSYGVITKLASVRSVDIPVLDLHSDRDRLVQLLVGESIKAVNDDGADVVIFGCTGMVGHAQAVQQGLVDNGYQGVPVLDPIPTTIRMAEAVVDLRLTHSKRVFQMPPEKRIVGYSAPERSTITV